MKNLAQKYLDWYTSQGKIVRLLFCILWDIPSNLYRLAKSIKQNNTIGIVIAVLLLICSGWVLFVIDILSIALKDKVYWLEDLDIIESTDSDERDSSDDGIDGTVE